ncbi:MAG: ChbG/HpnK family deacetylase [Clostridiales bacterium]|jgi:hypothetical protein|nr:ChbG/HpnK family deacetylase [Clostridiales bacterium]
MNKRYLIINADDFGISHYVNAAVERLYSQGLINSASILIPAAMSRQAIDIALLLNMSVGAHWTLRSEYENDLWEAASKGKSFCAGGLLPFDKDVIRRSDKRDVANELSAQLTRLNDTGLLPDHADCHGNDLYGLNGRFFFIPAFRLCAANGLAFRLAKTRGFLNRMMGSVNPAVLAMHKAIVALAFAMGVPLPDDMVTDPRPIKDIESYDDLKSYYMRELARSPVGVTEVFLHPSMKDETKNGEWIKREWEYRLLLGGDLIEFARREGFILTSWRSIPLKDE